MLKRSQPDGCGLRMNRAAASTHVFGRRDERGTAWARIRSRGAVLVLVVAGRMGGAITAARSEVGIFISVQRRARSSRQASAAGFIGGE